MRFVLTRIMKRSRTADPLSITLSIAIILFLLVRFFTPQILAGLSPQQFSQTRVAIGGIKAGDAAFQVGAIGSPSDDMNLIIRLRFKGADYHGYQDLFQTDKVNSGIRVELHDTIAVLVIAAPGEPDGHGLVLTNNLTRNMWHELDLTLYSRAKGQAILDGTSITIPPIGQASTQDVRFGIGFDATRRFRGEIEAATLSYGVADAVSRWGYYLHIVALPAVLSSILCLILRQISLRLAFRPPLIDNLERILTYTVTFYPVFFIIMQSFLKQPIQGFICERGYWIIRIGLFISFLPLLFIYPNKALLSQAQTLDHYEKARSAADPLLGLRALACLNVFFGHWFLVVFPPSTPAASGLTYVARMLLSGSPWCGVWMFFSLSGYLITKGFVTGRHNISRSGLLRYYRNRVLRIFPVYFISIIIVAFLLQPDALDLSNHRALSMMMDALLFDQEGNGVIGALWSVSTEVQFYLIAPALFIFLSYVFRSVTTIILVLTTIIALACLTKFAILSYDPTLWSDIVYRPLLMNFDCFLSGSAAAFLVNKTRRAKFYLKGGIWIGAVLTGLAEVIFLIWSYPEMVSFPGVPGPETRIYYLSMAPGATALSTAIIIFAFEVSKRDDHNNLLWRTSTFFGMITYCFYVLHEPIILWLRKHFPADLTFMSSLVLFPVGLALCIGAALFFYKCVESPFDRIRAKRKQSLPKLTT